VTSLFQLALALGLVLATGSAARADNDNIEYVDGWFTLLRQASGAIGRGTRGRGDDEGKP
jgi:hypothetical protein